MPGILNNRGYSIERIISHLWYTRPGRLRRATIRVGHLRHRVHPLRRVPEIFRRRRILHQSCLRADRMAKRRPAKTSVLASGFFGMISGSSIANAVTVGSFTIPLMKKAGYRKEFAGAVEAASSTGGQIMPPVMGAAAFIMVEFIGMPYDQIIISPSSRPSPSSRACGSWRISRRAESGLSLFRSRSSRTGKSCSSKKGT